MQGAANRIPVFAYTKMHANPPITTVTEQCWWPNANEDSYHIHEYNDRRIKYHFARPKSCHFADHSRKNKVSKPRPNTAFSPSTTTMSVTGEKYVTTTSPTVTSTPSTSTHSRSSTPDQLLMHEVYDIYSQSLSTPNLLRRPVTEMSKRSTNDEFPTCEDFRQSAMEFLLQKLDLGIEDEFKPTVVEPVKPTPQPKLAIDITLCDSAGTLLGIKEEPLWDNSATSNPSDVIQNKSNTKSTCA
uniref:Uncharacterized protein n=1 Tax=Ciona savignyi TaxID=51511 RepID=H2Y7X8_CIOSA